MPVGTSAPMRDAVARVTGRLHYAGDIALPGMLAVRVLRSPLAHARIARLETAAAERLPGVVAILTGADLGRPGGPDVCYGVSMRDQPVIAHERVRFVGEPVALVAAESAATAAAAIELISAEYEPLPAVFDTDEATRPGAPLLHEAAPGNLMLHAKLRHGDLAAGLAAADLVVEERFSSPAAQTTSLETHVVAAQWCDGRLTVWTGAQAPFIVQRVLAELFGLPTDAVRVVVGPLGGGFGGKGHVRIEPMVAALAWKAGGRPVKLALSRAEEFVTVTKHAATITIASGVRRDGTLTARRVTMHWNVGAYADASPMLVQSAVARSVGPYRIPAVHVDSYGIYTNLPSAAAFRGAMSSQTTWAYESHMDTIAARLGMDPVELRRRNLLRTGDRFCTGETVHDMHVMDCLETVAGGLGWRVTPKPEARGHLRYGRGVAVMMKSTVATSTSECWLRLAADGRLTLGTSSVEMGQGAHTVLAQIAAEAVGVALAAVDVRGPDTATTPFDSSTSACRATTMMGEAVQRAGAALRARLAELAAPWLECPAGELIVDGGFVWPTEAPDERLSYAEVLQRSGLEHLLAEGRVATKGGLDPETGQGVATPHWHQGAGACEIELDTETGKLRVLRFHAASFAGRVVNPALARLQNDGNVIFGLGPALQEQILFDGGRVLNDNLGDYLVPSFLDLPGELHSTAIEDGGETFHGIGEMTLPPVAPAIANAIYDAIGIRIHDLPLTPECVLRAIRGQ